MKLMSALAGATLAAAMLAAPAGALAQPLAYPAPGAYGAHVAYTTKAANLRAGPDRYYPVVAVLAPATQVVVQGCLPDYRWCDVVIGHDRGWVYAGNLRYPYQYGYLSFPGIAPYISIAILSFTFHDYWDRHYRDRPWYADRDRYVRPPPRPHASPPWVQPSPPPPHVVPPNPRPWVQPPAQPPRVQPPPPLPPRVQPPRPQPPHVRPPPRVHPQSNPREQSHRQDAREEEVGRPGPEEERRLRR